MTEKGIRKSGLLATTITTKDVGHPLLTVSSGRTFVLTDLIVTVDPTVLDSVGSAPVIALFDESHSGATAPSQTNAKLKVGIDAIIHATASVALAPLKLHLENGPEFSTAVSVATEQVSQTISSGGIYVGGYER